MFATNRQVVYEQLRHLLLVACVHSSRVVVQTASVGSRGMTSQRLRLLSPTCAGAAWPRVALHWDFYHEAVQEGCLLHCLCWKS